MTSFMTDMMVGDVTGKISSAIAGDKGSADIKWELRNWPHPSAAIRTAQRTALSPAIIVFVDRLTDCSALCCGVAQCTTIRLTIS
jgi:hypothetical protein